MLAGSVEVLIPEVPLDEDIAQPWLRAIGTVSLGVSKAEVSLDYLLITPVDCDPFRGEQATDLGLSQLKGRTRRVCWWTGLALRGLRHPVANTMPADATLCSNAEADLRLCCQADGFGSICPGKKGNDRHLHCMAMSI